MRESELAEAIVRHAKALYDRGLTHGSTGNISVRLADGWLMTPTGASFGHLDPARLSRLGSKGELLSGDAPTKEAALHRAMYDARPTSGAVVHLHATHSVAVSVLEDVNSEDVLPPLTAYYVMRIGRLPLVPFFPPGDAQLAEAVRGYAGRHHAVLLAHHGPVVAGSSLEAAVDAIEELEATARLHLLLRHERCRTLSAAQVADVAARFPHR
jgi:ribulose-5-phosphate 4-epimerase/fuculose-1-phosphate aldolase